MQPVAAAEQADAVHALQAGQPGVQLGRVGGRLAVGGEVQVAVSQQVDGTGGVGEAPATRAHAAPPISSRQAASRRESSERCDMVGGECTAATVECWGSLPLTTNLHVLLADDHRRVPADRTRRLHAGHRRRLDAAGVEPGADPVAGEEEVAEARAVGGEAVAAAADQRQRRSARTDRRWRASTGCRSAARRSPPADRRAAASRSPAASRPSATAPRCCSAAGATAASFTCDAMRAGKAWSLAGG